MIYVSHFFLFCESGLLENEPTVFFPFPFASESVHKRDTGGRNGTLVGP